MLALPRGHTDARLPTSRIVRNEFLLFIKLLGLVIATPRDEDSLARIYLAWPWNQPLEKLSHSYRETYLRQMLPKPLDPSIPEVQL